MATVQIKTDPKDAMSAAFTSRVARGSGTLLLKAKRLLRQEVADKGGGYRRKTLGIWMYEPTMDLMRVWSQDREPMRKARRVQRLAASAESASERPASTGFRAWMRWR